MNPTLDSASVMWAATCFVFLISCSIPVANKINEVQPTPYMDEVFHVPQSLAYYHGNYSQWDDKITTLPGLYCVANILLKGAQSLGIINPEPSGPSAAAYRSINLIINGLNFWCIHVLLDTREKEKLSGLRRAFAALTLSLFPLHYFFSFLYYTDPLSTLLVLCMMICAKQNRNSAAALSGLCAVLTRQNNIIWIVWNCTVTSWELCKHYISAIEEKIKNLFPLPPENVGNTRAKKRAAQKAPMPTTAKDLLQIWISCGRIALPKLYAHAIVLILFIGFVLYNGSIVVGDKSAHKATINIPQLFYFSTFVGFFTFFSVLLNLKRLVFALKDNFKLFVFLVVCSVFIVKLNTPVHPYLLADNRHYTFYIWKRVYEWFPIVRFSIVPVYIALLFHICLDSIQHPALIFCTTSFIFLALVPQLLLEYRYYIIPYLILRLSSGSLEWKHLIPEFLLYLVINYATINLFLYKPFIWSHTNETQRFMW